MTWTPYGLVSLYSAFINPEDISPLCSTLPALFAKSSMVWSTIFYIFSNKEITKRFKNDFFNRTSTNSEMIQLNKNINKN